VKLVRKSVRKV